MVGRIKQDNSAVLLPKKSEINGCGFYLKKKKMQLLFTSLDSGIIAKCLLWAFLPTQLLSLPHPSSILALYVLLRACPILGIRWPRKKTA